MSDHEIDSMKGKVKETLGDITGDKGLQIEGKLDQTVAAAQKHIDGLTDKVADEASKLASDTDAAPKS